MINKLYYSLIAALALLLGTIAYCFASSDEYLGTCVGVIDGDTCLLYTSDAADD